MSGRALITLAGARAKATAMRWIAQAPSGTVLEFKGPQRSNEQNRKLWALLTDVARAKPGGRSHTTDQWKALFMHGLGREVKFLPALDGSTFIPYGGSSSQMTKGEMVELVEFIYAWGSEHGVTFSDMERPHAAE